MSNATFLHQIPDVKDLFEVVAKEHQLLPDIVEKDYWVMHCLWGLQQQNFKFELKGGTSLTKGFGIIERFSEDIDIQIHSQNSDVKIGKNQNKPVHTESRRIFFETIANSLKIQGMDFYRDHNFDDPDKMRSAGIRGEYVSLFPSVNSLKEGVVLELGFDQTTPNLPCDITSWAFEKALQFNLNIIDNRAKNVLCYCPEYTFVEKLQTISTKYRLQQEQQKMPINFLRHYYDVYKLLENQRVINFIGTDAYKAHKQSRFRTNDQINIKENQAFILSDKSIRRLYSSEFAKKASIYFGRQPQFDEILQKISEYIDEL